MAAFKGLLDSQCGNVNPLVQLTQNFTQDKTRLLQDGLGQTSANRIHDVDSDRVVNQYVQDYHRPLDAPTTFQLDRILSNLQVSSDPIVDERERQWSREFFTETSPIHQPSIPFQQQQMQRTFFQPSTSFLTEYPSLNYPSARNFFLPAIASNQEISHDEKNIRDYLKEIDSTKFSEPNAKTSEQNDVNPIVDRILNNEFFSTIFGDENVDIAKTIPEQYEFTENNPYLNHVDPFEAGCQRLKVHDIVNASLYFEAAVQKDPNHVAAWLYLGITMSENEQDLRAIVALKKCVQLDPTNLSAYLFLASSYANESMTNEATNALTDWMRNNPKYSKFVPQKTTTNHFDDVDLQRFEKLQNAFLLGISSTPDQIDGDLQVGLGILFHLSCDYEKAAECFETAVSADPSDARLWNKLGASLANGGQSERAVDAYYRALNLSPGFVRARYNLGISCYNLRAYKQAVEHFLTALKQQSEGIGPTGVHVQMSENIWRTLAVALNHLERDDLLTSVNNRDLTKLLNEFRIQ